MLSPAFTHASWDTNLATHSPSPSPFCHHSSYPQGAAACCTQASDVITPQRQANRGNDELAHQQHIDQAKLDQAVECEAQPRQEQFHIEHAEYDCELAPEENHEGEGYTCELAQNQTPPDFEAAEAVDVWSDVVSVNEEEYDHTEEMLIAEFHPVHGDFEKPSTDACPYPPGYIPPMPTEIVGTYSTHGLQPQPSGLPPVKVNQDYGATLYPVGGKCQRTIMFTVCDGHGKNGSRASQLTAKTINATVDDRAKQLPPDKMSQEFRSILSDSFEAAHQRLDSDTERHHFEASGTTAVVVVVCEKEMWIAHAGDSRAVLSSTDGSIVELTEDHKVSNPSEAERIRAYGGQVKHGEDDLESSRVLTQDCHGNTFGLGMTRSIGDLSFRKAGISHEPTVTQYIIEATDEWVILASDGIWEFLPSDEAIEVVRDSWALHHNATMATRALISRAKDLWFEIEGCYRDDITATVINLPALRDHLNTTNIVSSEFTVSNCGTPTINESPQGALGLVSLENSGGDTPTKAGLAAGRAEFDAESGIYEGDGAQFMKRRASVLPVELGSTTLPKDLAFPDSSVQVFSAANPRRLSQSPEIDMNLWLAPANLPEGH